MAEARRTFGPVALLGLAATGLGAVAGHRAMLDASEALDRLDMQSFARTEAAQVEFPLAGALALVGLACWGVLLVTRGVVRRIVAVVAALAAAGTLLVLLVGGFVQKDDAAADLASERLGLGSISLDVAHTGWFWVALVAALGALAAAAAAVRLSPSWPEMGSRYDAPTAGTTTATPARGAAEPAEERSNLDLWKSLDEGSDPTER